MTFPGQLDIPIKVTEAAGLERFGEPVRIGVPLPRGQLRDLAGLRLESNAGQALPLQARVLAHWPDSSVKWVLIDTLVSVAAGATSILRLQQGSGATALQTLRIVESEVAIEVDTGAAVFRIPRSGGALVASVKRAEREELTSEGLCIVYRNRRGVQRQTRIVDARTEEHGPLRVAVVLDGVIAGTDRRRPVEFQARLVLVAGSGVLEIDFRIRNPRRARHRGGLWDLGDPGSQLIRELALVLAPAAMPTKLRWCAGTRQPLHEVDDPSCWSLYQDSSGGEQWNSPNHLGADGQLTVSFRGYRVRGAGGAVLASGDRATPCAELVSDGNAIACAMESFWQNFPKALRVVKGQLQAALFPDETRAATELQGGEQKRHRLWFAFGRAGEGVAELARRLQPLQVALEPQAVEASHAIHGFAAPRTEDDPRYVAYMRTIIEGEHSFFAGREAIDEYGWRNFGDVYADHEAVRHKGKDPFVSHYNNQYDVVFGTLLQGLRSGEAPWFELARDLARHVADIDIYHTQDDKPAYNGGLFWHSDHYLPAGLATHRTYSRMNAKGGYGGGPDNEHNYTSGLLHYHYLSGDPEAADAVRSLADFVIAMDDGSRTIFRLFDSGPTGNASKTVSMDYHGPGRGAGNSINALMDGFVLTGTRRYLSKADELIQRCIHPGDDIARNRLDDPENRWSYLVFLQALGKYLVLKQELGEIDKEFCYVRDSLLHYATWMLANERPYQEQLHKVLLPTETWPAQDVRKQRVLATAAAYCGDELLRHRMREDAELYADRCLSDLLVFRTAYLVRPRVLLAAYGAACPHKADAEAGAASLPAMIEAPKDFVGQRRRVTGFLVKPWQR